MHDKVIRRKAHDGLLKRNYVIRLLVNISKITCFWIERHSCENAIAFVPNRSLSKRRDYIVCIVYFALWKTAVFMPEKVFEKFLVSIDRLNSDGTDTTVRKNTSNRTHQKNGKKKTIALPAHLFLVEIDFGRLRIRTLRNKNEKRSRR